MVFHQCRAATVGRDGYSAAGRVPCTSRSGISLMEVLISVFVVSIGLLGIAALIPVANYSLVETSKSDRSAACGQAAMRDACVRRVVELVPVGTNRDRLLAGHAIVVDPLLFANTPIMIPNPTSFGSLTRSPLYTQAHLRDSSITATMSLFEASRIFRWNDDLLFDMREGSTLRPLAWDTDSDGMVDAEQSYSWFFTISPAPAEDEAAASFGWIGRRRFVVSVAVCYKRSLDVPERRLAIPSGGVYGPLDGDGNLEGALAGIQLTIPTGENPPALDSGDWVLLCGTRNSGLHVAEWYRIAGGSGTYYAVEGPYWPSETRPAEAVIVPSVLGVYTTTISIDDSPEWQR